MLNKFLSNPAKSLIVIESTLDGILRAFLEKTDGYARYDVDLAK